MGIAVSYASYVARIRDEGSWHDRSEDLPLDVVEFRRELRRAGKQAGIRVLTSNKNGYFIAWDPEYVVPEEKLRAVMDAVGAEAAKSVKFCPSCGNLCQRQGATWHCLACDLSVLP